MARTKEFDEDEALEAAMNVFWKRGYEGTSIQDLVDATGVQRQSLYDTFGSKHEIFMRSLMRYQASEGSQIATLIQKHPEGGLSLIRAIFESYADKAVDDARGCFATNSAAELAAVDLAVAERIRVCSEELRVLFEHCLVQAQRNRKLKTSSSPPALAHFLVNAFVGLRLMSKTRPSKAMIHDVVSVTLDALR